MGLVPFKHKANAEFSRVCREISVSLQADPPSLFSGFVTEVGCVCGTSLCNELPRNENSASPVLGLYYEFRVPGVRGRPKVRGEVENGKRKGGEERDREREREKTRDIESNRQIYRPFILS